MLQEKVQVNLAKKVTTSEACGCSGLPHAHSDLMVRDLRGFVGPVLIFGGTFDPPHLGHLRAAREAKRCFPGAPLVFVPTGQNPLKAHGSEADADTRMEMLTAAAAGETDMKVCPLQLCGLVPNHTAGLLRALREASPLSSPVLVLGSDCIKDLAKWREVQELPNLATALIVAREGQPGIPSLIEQSALSRELRDWLERALIVGPVGDHSSSRVRLSLKEHNGLRDGGHSLEALPVAIQEIITRKGLYGGDRGEVRLP